jgi:hypothetical protein
MNQNLWGPKYWFTLHTITFEYPIKPTAHDKQVYYNFITSLQYIIPCSICKVNFKKNLKSHPLENNIHSRKELVHWMIDVHNKVNLETGKRIYSYDEVITLYEKLMNKEVVLGEANTENISTRPPKNKKIYINIILIVLILMLITIIVKNRLISR